MSLWFQIFLFFYQLLSFIFIPIVLFQTPFLLSSPLVLHLELIVPIPLSRSFPSPSPSPSSSSWQLYPARQNLPPSISLDSRPSRLIQTQSPQSLLLNASAPPPITVLPRTHFTSTLFQR
ncbi:hypothetical protein E2C01_095793 [Portunus trituberculatus]|uniref:Uncharacterized protein n=1 Tax=Portunus trituberculatus TaxID=210409 RepID=A0A5B7K1B6_PORTR|nr:hypothetical protein [Portunus trituberculatus]